MSEVNNDDLGTVNEEVPGNGAGAAAGIPPENVIAAAADDLAKEYAALQEKYIQLQQQNILEKVCAESGCTDPEYFRFCAARRNVAPGDIEGLRRFAVELAASSPGCFTARITPGSHSGSGEKTVSAAGPAETFTGDRIAMIALAIDSAPDAGYR
ncbi:MAG: hypothetical protein IKC82_01820 [Lentisphaeria bacterium]|nr:hypothetical protein [Lentisphaeria bacterium]